MKLSFTLLFCIAPISYGMADTKPVKYKYSVIERNAKDVVDDLSTLVSKEITLTHPLYLNITNWSVSGSDGEIVSDFSSRYNILYNYDGVKYELTPPSAATVKVFSPVSMKRQDLIKRLRVFFPRFSEVSVAGKDGIVIVRGSDNFVNIAGKIAETNPQDDFEIISYGQYLGSSKNK